MHFEFVEPAKRHADLIIPEGGNPEIGIEFLCGLIREKLRQEIVAEQMEAAEK